MHLGSIVGAVKKIFFSNQRQGFYCRQCLWIRGKVFLSSLALKQNSKNLWTLFKGKLPYNLSVLWKRIFQVVLPSYKRDVENALFLGMQEYPVVLFSDFKRFSYHENRDMGLIESAADGHIEQGLIQI